MKTLSSRVRSYHSTRIVWTTALVALGTLMFLSAAFAQDWPTLPDYKPARQVSGTLRSWGNPHMADLLNLWQQGFSKYHPEIRYEDTLKGTSTAQWGLQCWVADIALMSRPMIPYESFGTYRRSYNFPVEIEVATGSYDVPGKSYAYTIFVHRDNPLTKLTIKQLDGIFSAERVGGWQDGMNWVKEGVARGPEGNIRTWGQLGLTGEWAGKTIIPYGQPSLVTGAYSYFQTRVSGGAGARNEKLREYADQKLLVADLSQDRYGIGYTGMCYKTPQVKAVAIADKDGGPYVEPTKANIASRAYPLYRAPVIYFTIDTKTGDYADPLVDVKVKEFLRYILSRQGQQVVAREGGYLPLTPAVVRAQLEKLENPPTYHFYRKDRRD
ncbi:MAG: substrate-binding domain-containing protein [Opitutaceae bacterium]|nr:substrate-binding domain-containing protein [Opitutaceae bacterium]